MGFWVMSPCSLVCCYKRFGEIYCLRLHDCELMRFLGLELLKYLQHSEIWVFGLCPSSGFFLNYNEKTQRFGN
jgi:hypothetical protein